MDLDRNYCHGRVWTLGKDSDLRLVGLSCEESVRISSRTHYWLFYCHISEAYQGHVSTATLLLKRIAWNTMRLFRPEPFKLVSLKYHMLF